MDWREELNTMRARLAALELRQNASDLRHKEQDARIFEVIRDWIRFQTELTERLAKVVTERS